MQMKTSTWIKNILFFMVIGLFALTHPATADNNNVTADAFLKNRLDQVFKVLQKTDVEQQEKSKEIVEIVSPMFDFQLMARLSLGKQQWTKLSEENREKFTELFVGRLRQSYLNKITAYTDETINYESPVHVNGKIHIPTHLVSKGSKISMLYKFYQSNGQWKIYDLEIQGVSIIRSYMAQFKEILQNGTFDDLLRKMEKPAND